jgi:protein-L-isoaspartate(D-aspartate) O-methyltransferase
MNQALTDFFNSLDRSFFMDEEYRFCASLDTAFPIGFGQTISQPSLVYLMTDNLQIDKHCRVLEIGTGSGYQTAFLSEFSKEVFTIERIAELAENARTRLEALGYTNIFYKIGDGSTGWAEYAPYDRILVTASAGKIPVDLVAQLGRGGRMIVPVGPPYCQQLLLITRDNKGELKKEVIEDVVFVELKGKYGWAQTPD